MLFLERTAKSPVSSHVLRVLFFCVSQLLRQSPIRIKADLYMLF